MIKIKRINYAIGDRYGKRVIIGTAPKRGHTIYVKTKCDCGSIDEVRLCLLVNGQANSCSHCRNKEIMNITQQGWYTNWGHMLQRCENSHNDRYYDYGGRGISVCPAWHDSDIFGKWAIENGYTDGLQIDRIDNNGNYEPDNCRWVTPKFNMQNRRNSIFVTIGGTTKTLLDWCTELGIRYANVNTTSNRKNIDISDAILLEYGKLKIKEI